MRDYGEGTAAIWGGDENCEHEFSTHRRNNDKSGGHGNTGFIGAEKAQDAARFGVPTKTCSKCGAWHGQLGLEQTPELYIEHLRMVFAEVKRVLKKTGTCWVNIGDSYASGKSRYNSSPHTLSGKERNEPMSRNKPDLYKQGYQDKCMCMIPERFAFMMIDLGYILRNKIIWHKPNPMPSSVKDRFNTTYEMLYFFSKSKKYWFDLDAVREEHKWIDKNGKRIGSDTIGAISKRKKFDKTMGGGGSGFNGHSGNYKADGTPLNNPSGKNPGDVIEMSKERWLNYCTYLWGLSHDHPDFFNINTQPFPEAHFATFPPALVERPLKCGCPAEVCKYCGKARVRIIEPTEDYAKNLGTWTKDTDKSKALRDKIGFQAHSKKATLTAQYKTIGWTDCQCKLYRCKKCGKIFDENGTNKKRCPICGGDLEEINKWDSGVILDPFAGSGTVGAEAEKLGRSSILIDIKRDYCEMAYQRLLREVGQLRIGREPSKIERVGF